MPELPPPPSSEGPAAPWTRWVAQARQLRVPAATALVPLGALAAVLVLGAVAWAAFRPGGSVGPPELTLPRAKPVDRPSLPAAGGASARAPAGGGSSDPGDADGPVLLHVAGAVRRPGVYRLAASARWADALDAAGGPTGEADLDAVNLAAKVVDGERIYLPRRGEVPPALAGAGGMSGAGSASGSPLDLNAATASQLEELPGVGPATAAAIVAYREEHGRFASVDELLEVRGIGEAKLAAMRSKVRVR